MRLILQKDIKNLGKAGDQVQVKKGYARNFLLPGKLAFAMDESRAKEWRRRKQVIGAVKKKAVLERKALLERISSLCLVFERESRAEGRLFGSVSPAEISAALEHEHGILVDKKDISAESLKTLGEHQALISLDSERKGSLKILIRKKLSKKESSGQPASGEEAPESLTEALENKELAGQLGAARAEAADSSASSPKKPSRLSGKKLSKKARRFAGPKKPAAKKSGPKPPRAAAPPAPKQKPLLFVKPDMKAPRAEKPSAAKAPFKKPAASASAAPAAAKKPPGFFSRLFARKK